MAPQASLGRGLSLVAGTLPELGAAGLGGMALPIVTRLCQPSPVCATRVPHQGWPVWWHERGTSLASAAGSPVLIPTPRVGLRGRPRGRGQLFPNGWAAAH